MITYMNTAQTIAINRRRQPLGNYLYVLQEWVDPWPWPWPLSLLFPGYWRVRYHAGAVDRTAEADVQAWCEVYALQPVPFTEMPEERLPPEAHSPD